LTPAGSQEDNKGDGIKEEQRGGLDGKQEEEAVEKIA